jgi:hypothetical protein
MSNETLSAVSFRVAIDPMTIASAREVKSVTAAAEPTFV